MIKKKKYTASDFLKDNDNLSKENENKEKVKEKKFIFDNHGNISKNKIKFIDIKHIPEFINNEVEAALYKLCVGIEYQEETEVKGEIKIINKYISPNFQACKLWLTNKIPDIWKDSEKDIDEDMSFKAFIQKYSNELLKEEK